jgi:hypothetical protein
MEAGRADAFRPSRHVPVAPPWRFHGWAAIPMGSRDFAGVKPAFRVSLTNPTILEYRFERRFFQPHSTEPFPISEVFPLAFAVSLQYKCSV